MVKARDTFAIYKRMNANPPYHVPCHPTSPHPTPLYSHTTPLHPTPPHPNLPRFTPPYLSRNPS